MTVTAETRLTLDEWEAYLRHPTKDTSYRQLARSGPAVEAFLAWKKLGRTAERTLDQYERDCARLVMFDKPMRARPIEEIRVEHLMLVMQTIPPGSWRRVRAAWGGLFTWAVRFELRPDNPVDRLPELRHDPTKVYELFDPAERAKVLTAAGDSFLPFRDRLGVLLFQELGIRKTEARLMQLRQFDVVNRHVVVVGKGRKERAVPFGDDLWTALMDFQHEPVPRVRTGDGLVERLPVESDYVFFPSGVLARGGSSRLLWTDPTRPMAVGSMHRWWERRVAESGVRYRSLHMNRHTVGTDLVEADVDAFTVRDWLGHADVRTTEIYVHNARGRLRKASQKLEVARRRAATPDNDTEGV